MRTREEGTVLIIFVGLLSVFIACFICAVNIYSIIGQQQYLRNLVDQAALLGTNQIEMASYYKSSQLNDVKLDSVEVSKAVNDFVKDSYLDSDISRLILETNNSEVSVFIEIKSKLPIGIGIDFVKVSALASAKLQVN